MLNKFACTAALLALAVTGCTQESQNRISRSIQNWTGTNGVLDILNGGEVAYRFIKIDKLTTATDTGTGKQARPYRYGYGVLDKNKNFIKDANEKIVYFEISDYSTAYVFYANPE